MTFKAKYINGHLVPEAALPFAEGEEIVIESVKAVSADDEADTVGKRLLKFAGMMKGKGLPTDGSINHDHYLYGTPKK